MKKIKIITTSVKTRRKLASICDKLNDWLQLVKDKRKTDKVIKMLRKQYIRTGSQVVTITWYDVAYELPPILNQLVSDDVITYTHNNGVYTIRIQEEEET